jgi:hypothetical protein
MKLICLVTTFLLLATTGSYAQQRDTIHYKSNTQKKVKMKDALGLNKKQAKEIKVSNREYKQKTQQLKSDTTLSKKDQKLQMKKLKMEKQQKMDAVLTPEQKEKAKALRKEKHNHKKEEKKQGAN